MSLSLCLSLSLSLSLSFWCLGHVSSSRWSNVSKVTSLWDHSLRVFSKCLCHFLCVCVCHCHCHCICLCQWVCSVTAFCHISQSCCRLVPASFLLNKQTYPSIVKCPQKISTFIRWNISNFYQMKHIHPLSNVTSRFQLLSDEISACSKFSFE